MFKKIVLFSTLGLIIAGLVFGAVNRTLAKNSNAGSAISQNNGPQNRNVPTDIQTGTLANLVDADYIPSGYGYKGNGQNYSDVSLLGSGELSDAEITALTYMREEEKLAHDVYGELYSIWNLPIFQNISQSEQTHTDAVITLLDRYGLTDPASSEIGVFADPTLQALYTNLVSQGSQSLAEALKVGAAIEEIDILDLQKYLAETDNTDIQNVLNNLMNGSCNHLQAFSSTLYTTTGETYVPQYMDSEMYNMIISTGGQAGGNGNESGRGFGRAHQTRP
jgi:hypothetical protein